MYSRHSCRFAATKCDAMCSPSASVMTSSFSSSSQRLVEVVRQVVDAQTALLAKAHLPDVLVHRLAIVGLGLDPVESRRQHHGEREIRIRRRVRHPQLDPRAQSATIRDADQRRPVAHRPRDVHRRFVPGHETLVRVDERIRDRAHAARVPQQPADVVQRRLATAPTPRPRPRTRSSLPRNSDWCVCIPLPFCPKIGFGMNDASKPELLSPRASPRSGTSRCCPRS